MLFLFSTNKNAIKIKPWQQNDGQFETESIENASAAGKAFMFGKLKLVACHDCSAESRILLLFTIYTLKR